MEHYNKENVVTLKELEENDALSVRRLSISSKHKSDRSTSQPNLRQQKNKVFLDFNGSSLDRCSSVKPLHTKQNTNRINDSNFSKNRKHVQSMIGDSGKTVCPEKVFANASSNKINFPQERGSGFTYDSSYRQRQHYPPMSNYRYQSFMTKSNIPYSRVDINLLEKDHAITEKSAFEYRYDCPIKPDVELDSHLEMVWADDEQTLDKQRNDYFQFYEAMKQVHVANWLKSQSTEEQRLYLDRTNRGMAAQASVC